MVDLIFESVMDLFLLFFKMNLSYPVISNSPDGCMVVEYGSLLLSLRFGFLLTLFGFLLFLACCSFQLNAT
ncbi:hypothetical protein CW304_32290 [Bacillus sp. UFRGS-B20]|nr:hypothetical protein CW304_32290 [Bacillus sp. UFRGS-B20]